MSFSSDKVTGNITMRITDTGGNVEFWVLTNSQTYNHQQQWSYNDRGSASNVGTFDMNFRGSWQMVGYIPVPGSGNVSWTIYDAGLGFPTTTHTLYINRGAPPPSGGVPPAPPPVQFTNLTDTSVRAYFGNNGDGGAFIDANELYWGADPGGPSGKFNTNDAQLTGLVPGTWYYFWGRVHNANGWSELGQRNQVLTWRIPDTPSVVKITNVRNNSVHVSFTDGAWDGGATVLERQFGWGTNPSAPTSVLSSNVGTDITGLTPGATYYFWSRTRNAAGWSNYSARQSVVLQNVPQAPSAPVPGNVTQSTVDLTWTPNGTNGQPILEYQMGWSSSTSAPATTQSTGLNKYGTVSGLQPGVVYYFWVRARNTYGWSPWSTYSSTRSIAGAWVNVNGTWKQAVPYVRVNGVWKVTRPWAKIAGVWKEMS